MISDEVLYSNSHIKLKRKEFLTLGPNKFVSRGIIDVWSMIANQKEEYRAPSSPLRFFATTNVCARNLLNVFVSTELFTKIIMPFVMILCFFFPVAY